MAVLRSYLKTNTEFFQENKAYNEALVEEFLLVKGQLAQGGGEAARKRHTEKGKMLARQRIEGLLDKGSPFLEVGSLAGGWGPYKVYDEDVPCGGLVAGVGLVHNRLVMVVANDATVKGGAYFPLTVKKHLRAQEIALENHLPCIYLVDSGGAYLPLQHQVFPDRDHFGRIFYNQSRMSAARIPQIAAVMGHCTAGGAYMPAMSDQSVIVQGTGSIYLAGPPLVKAATGEEVSPEDLGGARVHTEVSGVADHYAENDAHALGIVRQIVAHLGARSGSPMAIRQFQEPAYDPQEILGLWPKDMKRQVDMRGVLARILDGSCFFEFKSRYATTLVTGFGHIEGLPCGIIANNGVLFGESALKATHFVELCTSENVPLVFLQNITGFMVGSHYERAGIAKDGAKLVHAISTSEVPKVTLIMGGSYGAGNYGMCGRSFGPRFVWTWPSSRISVMGGEQAAQVMITVKDEQRARQGLPPLTAEERGILANPIRAKYELEGHPYYASARLWDDGVVGFLESRRTLAMSLAIALVAPIGKTQTGIMRM